MAEFKKNNRMSGGSRPRTYGASSSSFNKELFDAECASCNTRCQVPFRPNGKKPVYCANCFSKNDSRGGDTRGDSRGDSRGSFRSDSRQNHSSTFNTNPRTYPSRTEAPAQSDRQITDLKRQLDTMNATLEKLVTAVDTFNRATALTHEIRKHFPADASAETKKAPAKKSVVKSKAPAKAPAKKTAKK